MFRYTKWTLLREIGVWVFAILLLSPLYLLVNIALKSRAEMVATPAYMPPIHPSLDSFVAVLDSKSTVSLPLGFFNSFLITAIAVIGLIVFGSATAYILNRRFSKVSKVAYYMILTGIVVPAQLGLVPLYIGANTIGLTGSPVGMGIVYVAMLMPLSVFLYGGFVRALSPEYEDAAAIDGASAFKTYVRIVFPMLSPATGTVATMAGIIVWNDFFTPLIFLGGGTNPTLPLVIYSFVGDYNVEWNNIFAVLILAMIPITVLYLIFQKKFIQGFSGGIKS
jgi:raffinose/stachyose/melibiose transport system permease protein